MRADLIRRRDGEIEARVESFAGDDGRYPMRERDKRIQRENQTRLIQESQKGNLALAQGVAIGALDLEGAGGRNDRARSRLVGQKDTRLFEGFPDRGNPMSNLVRIKHRVGCEQLRL